MVSFLPPQRWVSDAISLPVTAVWCCYAVAGPDPTGQSYIQGLFGFSLDVKVDVLYWWVLAVFEV